MAGKTSKIQITDSAEVKELLNYLRDMKISYTKTQGLLEVGTDSTTLMFLDANGKSIRSIKFHSDFLRDNARLYVLDSNYLQEYYNMLDELKESMFE